MGFSKCGHDIPWRQQAPFNNTGTCPHGYAHFEVTWPNPTVLATEDKGQVYFLYLMAIYGTIPYFVIGFSIFEFFVRRGTRELNFIVFVGFATGLNEILFKNIVQQDRPQLSCLVSCGMPSGHSTLAAGFLTMSLIDILLRTTYRPDQDIVRGALGSGKGWGRILGDFCISIRTISRISLTPLSSWDELSHVSACLYSLFWILVLVPVSFSRVANHDHTVAQVLFGSGIGFFEACVWTAATRVLQHRYNHRLGMTVATFRSIPLLIHNFALPRFLAEVRCKAISADRRCLSQDPDSELQWYQKLTENYLLDQKRQGGRCTNDVEMAPLRITTARTRTIPTLDDIQRIPSRAAVQSRCMEDREREYMQRRHDEIQMAREAASSYGHKGEDARSYGGSRQDQSCRLVTPQHSSANREGRFRLEDLEETPPVATSYSLAPEAASFVEPGSSSALDMTSTASVQSNEDGFLTPRERRTTVTHQGTGMPSFGMSFIDPGDDNRFLTLDDDTPQAHSHTSKRTSREIGPSVPLMVSRMSGQANVTRFSKHKSLSSGSAGSNSSTSMSEILTSSKRTARMEEMPEICEGKSYETAASTEANEDPAVAREGKSYREASASTDANEDPAVAREAMG